MNNTNSQKNSTSATPTRTLPVVAITSGDPNGVGYEVLLKAVADQHITEICCPIIYGNVKIALGYQKTLGEDFQALQLNVIRSAAEAKQGQVNIINCYDDFELTPGKSTAEAGKASLMALQRATNDIKAQQIDILLTAPINKENIQSDQFQYSGHTEYLTRHFSSDDKSLMMMVSEVMRVALVTNHLPISKVAESITEQLILDKLELLDRSLKDDFLIRSPRIAVLALNPHAGDNGLLGNEESQIIRPAIEKANERGMLVFGPYAADGFFGAGRFRHFDAVLAMYHDQGLAPFKALDMEGVNYTAGLNIVRTSPDHGTAYDLVGKNQAQPSSFSHALYLALDILKARRLTSEINANPLKKREVPASERRTPPVFPPLPNKADNEDNIPEEQ